MTSPVTSITANESNFHQELNADLVLDYLLTHPGFLESVVTGPQISKETFQRWSLKRNNKLRRDSRRLLSGYTTPTGRSNSRRILFECSTNRNALLYELALTCAHISQADQFELLVRAGAVEEDPRSNDSLIEAHPAANPSTSNVDRIWLSVIRGSEPGSVKLRKARKQKKLPVHVLKLFDCNEILLGEVHFYSVVNDRDAQYLQVLGTWGGAMVHFAKIATAKDFPAPTTVLSPLPPEDVEYVNRQRKLNSFLLDVIKSIFQDIITMDSVIFKVMNFAQKLVDADRASLFLVDNKTHEIFARIFDISQELDENGQPKANVQLDQEGNKEIRFPIGKGIAGHVALTGESLNITNAYEDERFNREIDSKTGYHTETILCMPIFIRNSVIGVVQMVNKRSGVFTQIDEESFETFANYCALALHHAKLYDKIRRSEQKYRVALEVLAYHSVCNRDEVNKLKKVQLKDKIPELDFFELDDLVRFILTVRKNYRKVPYHNWTHGWTVAHAMFVFLLRDKEFRPLEKLALFVAAVCHDLDHRGKSNAYMKSMSTPLASIYSTSVMEHHHFNQTVTILQQLSDEEAIRMEKQKNDKFWDPIKQSGQESFVAGSNNEVNNATMRMSLLHNGPQAVSTPFRDGRRPLVRNRTKDLFESLMAGGQMDQSLGVEEQSKNSFQGNMTYSIFENIRASQTRLVAPGEGFLHAKKPFDFVSETVSPIEEDKTSEDGAKKTSIDGNVDWAASSPSLCPSLTSANEKLNHLISLMTSARGERDMSSSNVMPPSEYLPVQSSIGRRPGALPMSDVTYVLHRERTQIHETTFSFVDPAKPVQPHMFGDSLMVTPTRSESQPTLSNTVNNKQIGALAFNEPMDFEDEETSGMESKNLDPKELMQQCEMAVKVSMKKHEMNSKLTEVLDRIAQMQERKKALDNEMKTSFQNLLSQRP